MKQTLFNELTEYTKNEFERDLRGIDIIPKLDTLKYEAIGIDHAFGGSITVDNFSSREINHMVHYICNQIKLQMINKHHTHLSFTEFQSMDYESIMTNCVEIDDIKFRLSFVLDPKFTSYALRLDTFFATCNQ